MLAYPVTPQQRWRGVQAFVELIGEAHARTLEQVTGGTVLEQLIIVRVLLIRQRRDDVDGRRRQDLKRQDARKAIESERSELGLDLAPLEARPRLLPVRSYRIAGSE